MEFTCPMCGKVVSSSGKPPDFKFVAKEPCENCGGVPSGERPVMADEATVRKHLREKHGIKR